MRRGQPAGAHQPFPALKRAATKPRPFPPAGGLGVRPAQAAARPPRAPSRPRVQALQRLGGLHPERPGSALPFPAFAGETTQAGPPTKRTRRTSLDAADSRSPPHGPLTRGFERARFPAGGPAGGPPGGCPDGTDAGGRRRACRCRFTRRASPPTFWAHRKREDKDSLTVGPRTAFRRLDRRGEDKDSPEFLIFPHSTTPPRRHVADR